MERVTSSNSEGWYTNSHFEWLPEQAMEPEMGGDSLGLGGGEPPSLQDTLSGTASDTTIRTAAW